VPAATRRNLTCPFRLDSDLSPLTSPALAACPPSATPPTTVRDVRELTPCAPYRRRAVRPAAARRIPVCPSRLVVPPPPPHHIRSIPADFSPTVTSPRLVPHPAHALRLSLTEARLASRPREHQLASPPAGRILFIARGWDPCYRRRPPLLLFIFRARLAAAGLQGRPPLLSAAGGIPCRVAGKPGGGGGLRVAAVGGGTLPAGGGGLIRGGPGTGRGSSGPRVRAD